MIVLTFKLLHFFNKNQLRKSLKEVTLDSQEESRLEKEYTKLKFDLSEYMKDCFELDSQNEKYISEELFIIPLIKNLLKFYFDIGVLCSIKPILVDLELQNTLDFLEEQERSSNMLKRVKISEDLECFETSKVPLRLSSGYNKLAAIEKKPKVVEITEEEIEDFADNICTVSKFEAFKKDLGGREGLNIKQSFTQNRPFNQREMLNFNGKDIVELLDEEVESKSIGKKSEK